MGVGSTTVSIAANLGGGWWEVLLYIILAGFFVYLGGALGMLTLQHDSPTPAVQGRRLLMFAGGIMLVALVGAVSHGAGLSPRPHFWTVLSSEIAFLRLTAFLMLGTVVGVALHLMGVELE